MRHLLYNWLHQLVHYLSVDHQLFEVLPLLRRITLLVVLYFFLKMILLPSALFLINMFNQWLHTRTRNTSSSTEDQQELAHRKADRDVTSALAHVAERVAEDNQRRLIGAVKSWYVHKHSKTFRYWARGACFAIFLFTVAKIAPVIYLWVTGECQKPSHNDKHPDTSNCFRKVMEPLSELWEPKTEHLISSWNAVSKAATAPLEDRVATLQTICYALLLVIVGIAVCWVVEAHRQRSAPPRADAVRDPAHYRPVIKILDVSRKLAEAHALASRGTSPEAVKLKPVERAVYKACRTTQAKEHAELVVGAVRDMERRQAQDTDKAKVFEDTSLMLVKICSKYVEGSPERLLDPADLENIKPVARREWLQRMFAVVLVVAGVAAITLGILTDEILASLIAVAPVLALVIARRGRISMPEFLRELGQTQAEDPHPTRQVPPQDPDAARSRRVPD